MRLTAGQAKILGRRQEQPVKEPGEILAVFVAGRLLNPLNATAWVWQKRARYARAWKERIALAVLESGVRPFTTFRDKHVIFTAHTHNAMDSDGLQAACKPIRDALIVCGVISGDADRDRHTFEYRQRINRARRGVEIRVIQADTMGPEAGEGEGKTR